MPILGKRDVNVGKVVRGRTLHRGSALETGAPCSNSLDQTSGTEHKSGELETIKPETEIVARRSERSAMRVLGVQKHRLAMKTGAGVFAHQSTAKLTRGKLVDHGAESHPNDRLPATSTIGCKAPVTLVNFPSRDRPQRTPIPSIAFSRGNNISKDDYKENIDSITGEEAGRSPAKHTQITVNTRSILADKSASYS
ncbi:hypothetical protein RUND412_003387 [Rhizina undulata]